MHHITARRLVVVVMVMGLLAAAALTISRVSAQDDLVAELSARLTERGVPLASLEITGRAPLRLEAILQSDSTTKDVSPADPLYGNLVQREVALANQRLGAGIDSVRITTMNAAGEAILWANEPVRALAGGIGPGVGGLTNDEVADLLRSRFPLADVEIRELSAGLDADGARVLSIVLGVQDIEAGDKVARGFAHKLRQLVDTLNAEEGTAISTYDVEIRDANGELLLTYGRDVLMSHEYGWFSDPSLYWWVRGG